MTDVDDIIDFIKSLRRGFDKDLFQSKIDELAYVVNSTGLVYEDFHTLFKVWLNLTIPITKWVNLGSCLAPPDTVEERTVQYALRWILANFDNQSNYSRLGFLLDWLTAAMECDSINMTALDYGYEVLYTMLTFEDLTIHAMKLLYTLTKPVDVTRQRVLELIHYAKKRESKKNMYRQLQVLLGLFKSYKPDCVPEDVPAISIHTGFKKLNPVLLATFKRTQERRNRIFKERQHLLWFNPINSERNRARNTDPLVPNIQFAKQHSKDDEPLKNFLEFSDPVSLLHYSAQYRVARPARLRALLCNVSGHVLLGIMRRGDQAFLSHDLHHTLNACFFEASSFSYLEKQDFLQKLVVFQRTIVQAVPIITRFLAQYLPLWNERDHFPEILGLLEWVSAAEAAHARHAAHAAARAGLRAAPLRQCAVLHTLTRMYNNLVYARTKKQLHFLSAQPPDANYSIILTDLAEIITTFSSKGLQVAPDDARALHPAVWSAQRRASCELMYGATLSALPADITLALPLISVSAVLKDNMAELMILYKKIMSASKTKNEQHVDTLSKYMSDLLNCLYSDEALSGRHNGLLFQKMHPQLVAKLGHLIPDVDAKLSIRNHLAFAPYTYIQSVDVAHKGADNRALFNSVIDQELPNLGRFLKKALPELRYQ